MRTRVVLLLCVVAVVAGGVVAFAGAQGADTEADNLSDDARVTFEDDLLESAKPALDRDGDPTTIEGTLPDDGPLR